MDKSIFFCRNYKGYNKENINMMLHCFHKELNISSPMISYM